MRHFAHHIGDYAAATAHLSFVEDAAYHRLLRRYYQDEKPLPVDVAAVQRLVGARTKDERAAVDAVLREFFTLADDGWHQDRADREIETYRAKAEAARENGTKGGRPPNRRKTDPVIPSVRTEKLTTPHEPLTNVLPAPKSARKARIPEYFELTEERRVYAKAQGCPDPDDTFARFKLHHGSKGTLMVDWDKAWQNWCRNEKNFTRPAATPKGSFTVPQTPTLQHDTTDQWRGRIRGWKPGKFWHRSDWGPEPDQPGCRVPAQILTEWRAQREGV